MRIPRERAGRVRSETETGAGNNGIENVKGDVNETLTGNEKMSDEIGTCAARTWRDGPAVTPTQSAEGVMAGTSRGAERTERDGTNVCHRLTIGG